MAQTKSKKSPIALKLISTKIKKLAFDTIEGRPIGKPVRLEMRLGQNHNLSSEHNAVSVLIHIDVFGKELPFEISLDYEGVFKLSRRVTEAEVEPYATVNCTAILFPYVREIIADITRRAGFAPLHLQSMNFVEFFRKAQKRDAVPEKGRTATDVQEGQ